MNERITKRLKTYRIITYGCQMNVRDSENIAGILERIGLVEAADPNSADLVLFNTCCIRDHAERKVFGNVGALIKIKEEHPDMVIAVCGCMMQQEGTARKLFRRFPFVDLVFGTYVLHRLEEFLEAVCSGERICITTEDQETVTEGLPSKRAPGQSAFVNITFGCNNFCSYCIVPFVRGRERSRTIANIKTEVAHLAAAGYSEVTLLGQNVNSYGHDLKDGSCFAGLLREISNVEGIRRIRFMTSHPKDLSDEMIAAMAETPNVCHHIHLPMQSGSDSVLKAMNRRYTSETYLGLIEKLHTAMEDVEISTDIIVGFPGETEEDFNDTLKVVKAAGFSAAYSFAYSPREGTKAAAMECQIPKEVKSERLYRLNALLEETTEENNKKYIGYNGEVLVEGYGERDGVGYAFGKLSNFKMIYFPGKPEMIGKYLQVRVDSIKNNSLYGELLV